MVGQPVVQAGVSTRGFMQYVIRGGLWIFVVVLGCAAEAEQAAGPWTPTAATWQEQVKPFLYTWCGGCHAKPPVPGATGCEGIHCFVDDPCMLRSRGCCTAENPFLSCEARLKAFGAVDGGEFTVGECAVMRVDYARALARSGNMDAAAAAADAARFLAASGVDRLLSDEEFDYVRGWVYGGEPLPGECSSDAAAP